jgi:NTE family protein
VGDDTDLKTVSNLGLALGGGGVLGAAHVGVLQVLRERGIRPSIVAGTSAGALIGAAYAGGLDPYRLERITLTADWRDVGDLSLAPGLGLLDTRRLRSTIEHLGGDTLIENLPMPYAAIATDVATGEAAALTRGSLVEALRASIAVPGLFRPARIDGRLLVDGGLAENLPIEHALALGATHVIAVRLFPEWDTLPSIRSSAHVHELEIRPDVTLIHPKLGHRSQWVKRDLPELIRLGREAAERVLGDYPVVEPRPEASAHR